MTASESLREHPVPPAPADPAPWGALLVVGALFALTACAPTPLYPDTVHLEPVAFSDARWTGVAVSAEERVFVNYPRWSDEVPVSVAELVDGEAVPYLDDAWHDWAPGDDPATRFVCVQSVHVDAMDRLWILDPASPSFGGVVPGGAKLLQVDLTTDDVVRVYRFDETVAPPDSYLNDVRVDTTRAIAYMTDSGAGALVVLDLVTGEARRVLDGHGSTRAEDVTLRIGGERWQPGDEPPQVHADGLALDAEGDRLYYQALTGRTMYSVPGVALRDASLSDADLARLVETVGFTGASDGLIFGPDGKVYISALEEDAVLRTTPDGQVETVVSDPALAWPDSFALGPGGWLYVTTARIHEGDAPRAPFGIFRTRVP